MKIYVLKHLDFCEHKIIYVCANDKDEAVKLANQGRFGNVFDKTDIVNIVSKPSIICSEIE